jgi:S1-C subfamily serine protease
VESGSRVLGSTALHGVVNYKGVVEIVVTSSSNNFGFGGSGPSQAEGSGFVYDANGDIVTSRTSTSSTERARSRSPHLANALETSLPLVLLRD